MDDMVEQDNNRFQRKIRSFVKREGRITAGQSRALEELLPEYGITLEAGEINFENLYSRQAETILEIGFGMGQSLISQAQTHSEINYFGIEVHRPGVGSLLKIMTEENIENIRVSLDDAIDVLEQQIPEQSLNGVQLFFPDPWHKKKHHKRRIVNDRFVALILSRLKPGGFFHLATDWENYAEQMLEVLSANDQFKNDSEDGTFIPRPDLRPLTKFEKRGHRLGHGVWDLMFLRKP